MAELPAEERRQAQGFHFEEDRAAYVVAHVMLRRVLRAHLRGEAPSIVRNPLGRPELAPRVAGGPTPSFNLTHIRGFAACAISDASPIGIDAEDIRRPIDIAELAARWYAPLEQRLLAQSRGERRVAMFFRIWTLKEAILKATGHGLRIEPNRFAVDPRRLQTMIPEGLGIPIHWQLAELVPAPYIRLALAIPGDGPLAPAAVQFNP